MPDWLMMRLPMITTAMFVFAVGACVGSLINVLVYRMPRGLDVVTPTSRCPSCGTKLTWRENIPILGWILLRGRCRFCQTKISPEYPIVEAIVAVLFGGAFVLWYMVPPETAVLGIHIGSIAPDWAHNGAARTWPAFVVLATMIGSLVAMTIIDARTCTIPLVLTWIPAAVALLFHVGHAVWFQHRFGTPEPIMPGVWAAERLRWITAPGEIWTLATGGLQNWRFVGMGIGGIAGLGVANLLLAKGLITRSFADYAEWESETLARRDAPVATEPDALTPPGESSHENGSPTDLWIQYPHARREMVRELAFLAPAVVGVIVGGWAASKIGGPLVLDAHGQGVPSHAVPLWLVVLGGVLMGYLIGGGLVWAVRIGGTLAFGKEAMGLGDVHLMAAVGACLGWIDPTIAFFGAAFVGVGWAVLAALAGGRLNRAMPYGPFLAIATLLVLVFKPAIEIGLGRLFSSPGPLNLP
jgi:leader peptidase (prepilin peptidase)/N-methyltransferase